METGSCAVSLGCGCSLRAKPGVAHRGTEMATVAYPEARRCLKDHRWLQVCCGSADSVRGRHRGPGHTGQGHGQRLGLGHRGGGMVSTRAAYTMGADQTALPAGGKQMTTPSSRQRRRHQPPHVVVTAPRWIPHFNNRLFGVIWAEAVRVQTDLYTHDN